MGFDKTDLLQQGGFESGDVIPVFSYNPHQKRTVSTTSTTFDTAFNHIFFFTEWDSYNPRPDVVRLQGEVNNGPGELGSIRIQNTSDSETVVSFASKVSGGVNKYDTGYVDYVPSTTSTPRRILAEVKTDTGTNSVDFTSTIIQLGVTL